MSVMQKIMTVALCVLATFSLRALPFLIFHEGKPIPSYIRYLGNELPPAIFAMLVVYCLRNVNILQGTHGAPEAISIALIVGLHLWKRNMLLSMASGTICYMLLVQLVFVA